MDKLLKTTHNRILLISSYIAPTQSVASIRWTKIGKYLARLGYSVSVLTDQKSFDMPLNAGFPALKEEASVTDIEGFNNIFVINNPLRVKAWFALSNMRRRFRKKNLIGTKSLGEGPVSPANWSRDLARNRIIAEAGIRQFLNLANQFDIIISTFDPLWPHMVARRFKELNPDLVWIADFRDPVYGAGRFEDKASRKWASVVTDLADVITYVADGGSKLLELPDRKVTVLSNGFDPEDLVEGGRDKSNTFCIAYTGTLYDGEENRSDIISIMRVLKSLVVEGAVDSRDIVFEYAGKTPALFDEFTKKLTPLPFECHNLGLVSHNEALRIQKRASLLAIATWNTTKMQGVVTGKLWEYLMSGVPVIATCTGNVPNSRMKEILEKTNGGVMIEECTSAEDMTKAKEYILSKYREWKETGSTSTNTNWEYLSQYSHENLARQVKDIALHVIHSRTNIQEDKDR